MLSTIDKPQTRIAGVGKVYSSNGEPNVVLRDCSFDIKPGKLTILLGPSGCGKSTLVKMIAGYEQPSVGEVHIGGKKVTGRAATASWSSRRPLSFLG